MAKYSRISFSGQNQSIDEIDWYYRDVEASVRLYFSSSNPHADNLFGAKTKAEIEGELETVLKENEQLVSLNILASMEAAFRIDYLQRCYKRKKDPLSKSFRGIYQIKGDRASLEEDILVAWKQHTNLSKDIFSDLKSVFRYRNWLAHGRYWQPRLGGKYDYYSVSTLAQTVFRDFPFEGT